MQYTTTTMDYNGLTGEFSNLKNFEGTPIKTEANGNQSLNDQNLGAEIKEGE